MDSEKKSKFSRRKIIKLGIFTTTAVVLSKTFVSYNASRKIASNLQKKIGGKLFRFKGLLKVKEYKLQARIVRKLVYLKTKVKYSQGHNSRLFSALEEYVPIGLENSKNWKLDINDLESTKNFYIRTEKPNKLTFKIDSIKIEGVDYPQNYKIEKIKKRVKPIRNVMMECAGNDRHSGYRLMSVADWDGLYLQDLFAEKSNGKSFFGDIKIDSEATHVLVEGFDETTNTRWNRLFNVESKPGASWIFSFEELVKHKAFFATHMNNEELTEDHGFPLRLVVPGYYGCSCIKWVNRIKFFNPEKNQKTEAQMREFSDRTNQDGVPKFYKDHKPPVIDLASTVVAVEKWVGEDQRVYYKFIGLIWGGIDSEDPVLKLVLRDKRNHHKVVLNEKVFFPKRNILGFTHWEYEWRNPKKGKYLVDIECLDENVFTRRLDSRYYRRIVKIKNV